MAEKRQRMNRYCIGNNALTIEASSTEHTLEEVRKFVKKDLVQLVNSKSFNTFNPDFLDPEDDGTDEEEESGIKIKRKIKVKPKPQTVDASCGMMFV